MIFKKAREDTRTRHHVYVTAALMEYYCSKVIIDAQFDTKESVRSMCSSLKLITGLFVVCFFLMFAG